MSKDLESRLRDALRPLTPRAEFTEKLLASLAAERRGAMPPHPRPARAVSAPRWWLAASMAAAALLAAGVHHHLGELRQRRQGMEARRQVMEALRVTDQKLDLAYQAIKTQSSASIDDNSGS